MILNEIAQKRRERIDALKAEKPLGPIRRLAEELANHEAASGFGFQPENFAFEQALKSPKTPGMAFICEVKKASPSKGVIAENFPFLEIAKEYESAGASAISCLTEPDWFLGRDEYLREIAASVQIPVLRKDFTIDAYQIYEAKTLGASAVLLICALLETVKLREFLEIAHSLRLAALVEAHSEEEVESALKADARIIGVNNRDLKTFKVDVSTSLRLRPLVPADRVFVSESGIQTAEQIADLRKAGVNGVLIGETFMRSENKKELLRSFC
ncbi:MAG: indole-3-glycerol phosphate synthase TrpC [Thermoguttaceae bacterium]|nr:indole-3-glycerol phosphate synthase TrpC [Thermoguttaceae bacterium]